MGVEWQEGGAREVSGAREHKNVDLSIVAAYSICQNSEGGIGRKEERASGDLDISRAKMPRGTTGWIRMWMACGLCLRRYDLLLEGDFSPRSSVKRKYGVARARSAYISLTAADYCRLPRCAVVTRGGQKRKEGRAQRIRR